MPENSAKNTELAATQHVADVTLEHLAEVYAEALIGAAESGGETGAVVEEFGSFLADVLRPNPKLGDVFASPWISREEKTALLDRVLGGRASKVFLNFLKVTARHGRLDQLEAIHRHAVALYQKRRGLVPVELTTAHEVSQATADELVGSLADVIGGRPVVRRRVDPDLIGGAVIRVGDRVYDGSIFSQLQTLREQLIDRSVHEIQSGRNRFRAPAGD